jgi:NTP pyrophosphatase (non-canonical NTP hydrolase)
MTMHMDEYQEAALRTAIYPVPVIYPALKLAGEAGEVAEKVGKLVRDKGLLAPHPTGNDIFVLGALSEESRKELQKELGDVLWYIAALANDLGISLGEVAKANIEKLASRALRGVIQGSGDNR